MSEHIKAVTDANFDQDVINSSKPVLVDFWAEWCGPCRALAPILEDVAATHSNEVSFVKANVDEAPQAAAKFGILSIPTLILFKNGEVAAVKIGAPDKHQLIAFVESNI